MIPKGMSKNFTPNEIEVGAKYEHKHWPGLVYLGAEQSRLCGTSVQKRLIIIANKSNDITKNSKVGGIIWAPGEYDGKFPDQDWWNQFTKIN